MGKSLGRAILNNPSKVKLLEVVRAKIHEVFTVPISALRQETLEMMFPGEAE